MNIADKITENLVMDGITTSASGGGTKVIPDWNQNDSAKPDYIKNRIGYDNSVYYVYYEDSLKDTYPSFNITTSEGNVTLYKTNDYVDPNTLIGKSYTAYTTQGKRIETINESMLGVISDDATILGEIIFFISKPTTISMETINITFPSSGIWIVGGIVSKLYIGTQDYVKIPIELLPQKIYNFTNDFVPYTEMLSAVNEVQNGNALIRWGIQLFFQAKISSDYILYLRSVNEPAVTDAHSRITSSGQAGYSATLSQRVNPQEFYVKSIRFIDDSGNETPFSVPSFDPDTDKGKVLGINDNGKIAWITK